jgi:hypothetical protein
LLSKKFKGFMWISKISHGMTGKSSTLGEDKGRPAGEEKSRGREEQGKRRAGEEKSRGREEQGKRRAGEEHGIWTITFLRNRAYPPARATAIHRLERRCIVC